MSYKHFKGEFDPHTAYMNGQVIRYGEGKHECPFPEYPSGTIWKCEWGEAHIYASPTFRSPISKFGIWLRTRKKKDS